MSLKLFLFVLIITLILPSISFAQIPEVFGNGVNGSLTITKNTTWTIPGNNYNFTDLTINAGVFLNVSPGVVIRVRGTLTVYGVITADGMGGVGGAGGNISSRVGKPGSNGPGTFGKGGRGGDWNSGSPGWWGGGGGGANSENYDGGSGGSYSGGGGGGAADYCSFAAIGDGGRGGNGGGKIIIYARTIDIKSSGRISANGLDGKPPPWWGGGGGGGGGGNIFLYFGSGGFTNAGTISAKGGNGGHGAGSCTGGTGGGGGYVNISGPVSFSTGTVDVSGGIGGGQAGAPGPWDGSVGTIETYIDSSLGDITTTTTTTIPTATTTTTTIPTTTTTLPPGTPLKSNETEFEVLPIFIKGDGIYLSGNTSYIAAYVQAYYPDFSYKEIGMNCYLDGDEFTSAQNCSVIFYPEKGVCSILWPNYDDLKTQHEMKCKIYNPRDLNQNMYINKTFVPIEFSVWTLKNYSSLVGEEFNIPIYIKNSGLFSDSYNVTIWVPSSSSNIIIRTENFTTSEIHGDAFDPHAWQQTGPETKDYQIKMVVLDASSSPQVCVDVSSQQMLTQGRITKEEVCMEIKSSFKSMPELSLIQILFIMLAATIFIFKFKKRF